MAFGEHVIGMFALEIQATIKIWYGARVDSSPSAYTISTISTPEPTGETVTTVETLEIAGPLVLTPRRFADERGYFSETYNIQVAAELGVPDVFVQDNESLSGPAGTVRGLHFQRDPFAQGKLVRAITGAMIDVAVDIRVSSPTFGRHVSVRLDAESGRQFWVPAGFAHGFYTLEPDTLVAYKVTALYDKPSERAIRFDDPDLAIEWPNRGADAVLSAKDAAAPSFAELKAGGQFFD